jgi:hypothetical protein
MSFNPLKTKRKLFYLSTQFVPRSKHLPSRLHKPITSCRRANVVICSEENNT